MHPLDAIAWLDPVLDRCRRVIADAEVGSGWTKKSDRGIEEVVTEVDLAVEATLVTAIGRRSPEAAILSEESFPDRSVLQRAGPCFVIDPIDGTDELVGGRPGYAISVALFHDRQPLAAALDFPAHDWRFMSIVGNGTLLNGDAVALSTVDQVKDARLAVSATQRGARDLEFFWGRVEARALVPTPAFAAKFAAVLAGECDAVLYLPYRPYPTAIWDYAASAILLAEAGGWYGTTEGQDLLMERPFLYRGGWIAAPPQLQTELIELAQRAPTYGN